MEKNLYDYLRNRCVMLEDIHFTDEELQDFWLDFIRIANKYDLVNKGIYEKSNLSIAIIDKRNPNDKNLLYVSHPYMINKILNEPRKFPVEPTFYAKYDNELNYSKLENKHVLEVIKKLCTNHEEDLKNLVWTKEKGENK